MIVLSISRYRLISALLVYWLGTLATNAGWLIGTKSGHTGQPPSRPAHQFCTVRSHEFRHNGLKPILQTVQAWISYTNRDQVSDQANQS